ncbi:MAG: lasso RiPP family leader peptide-containing protein [Acidimicrobiia bacterium]|nr:lasso RiPP family leader peptide-containing protein [Acidimicrobiia bacterium]NNF08993.1 lasso RiPP family leader peptide-containing protein [Acidimicrobiia bacterium]NNL71542.1 lasso RiPP family leader peptide-containing protein [Acidimicrobiia bacterium]
MEYQPPELVVIGSLVEQTLVLVDGSKPDPRN